MKPIRSEISSKIYSHFRKILPKHEGELREEFNYEDLIFSIFEIFQCFFKIFSTYISENSVSLLTDMSEAFDSFVDGLSLSKVCVDVLGYILLQLITVNPNEAGLFEGSFSWRGGQFHPLFIFQE